MKQRPKQQYICHGCGITFERYVSLATSVHLYCTLKCYQTHRSAGKYTFTCQGCGKVCTAYTPSRPRKFCSHPCFADFKMNAAIAADSLVRYIPNSKCYLKEARAMLKGKNTRGKNKCVVLEGDESYVSSGFPEWLARWED